MLSQTAAESDGKQCPDLGGLQQEVFFLNHFLEMFILILKGRGVGGGSSINVCSSEIQIRI